MNMDTKALNKRLTNQILVTYKKDYIWSLSQKCKVNLKSENQLMIKEKSHDYFNRCNIKHLTKSNSLSDNNTQYFLNLIKSTAHIDERLDAFPLKSREAKEAALATSSQHCTEGSSKGIWAGKRNKRHPD